MSAHTAETISQSVSVVTLSARIAESGSITHVPEIVRPVGSGGALRRAEQLWELVAEARVNREVAPLLAEIATAEPPADVAHLYASVESRRRTAVAETRRTAGEATYERVVGEMHRASPRDAGCPSDCPPTASRASGAPTSRPRPPKPSVSPVSAAPSPQ